MPPPPKRRDLTFLPLGPETPPSVVLLRDHKRTDLQFEIPLPAFRVDRFILFSSYLAREGAIYRAEAEYPLAEARA